MITNSPTTPLRFNENFRDVNVAPMKSHLRHGQKRKMPSAIKPSQAPQSSWLSPPDDLSGAVHGSSCRISLSGLTDISI